MHLQDAQSQTRCSLIYPAALSTPLLQDAALCVFGLEKHGAWLTCEWASEQGLLTALAPALPPASCALRRVLLAMLVGSPLPALLPSPLFAPARMTDLSFCRFCANVSWCPPAKLLLIAGEWSCVKQRYPSGTTTFWHAQAEHREAS